MLRQVDPKDHSFMTLGAIDRGNGVRFPDSEAHFFQPCDLRLSQLFYNAPGDPRTMDPSGISLFSVIKAPAPIRQFFPILPRSKWWPPSRSGNCSQSHSHAASPCDRWCNFHRSSRDIPYPCAKHSFPECWILPQGGSIHCRRAVLPQTRSRRFQKPQHGR